MRAMVVKGSYRKLWTGGALLASLICLASVLAFGCSSTGVSQEEGAEAASTQPNIIFVLTDDLDYASAQQMPQLRSLLVEEGASFENAFVDYSVCCPSRATILTGLYTHNHDVTDNVPPDGGFEKFFSEGLEENTIAVHLQEGDYRTAFFGKYLNGYPADDPTHVPPGWNEWYGKLRGQELYRYRINENGRLVSYGNRTEDFYTDVLSKQAIDYLKRAALDSRPFFMYVAPTAPHVPATPAERHKGTYAEEQAPHPPSFDEEDVSDKPSWIKEQKRFSKEQVSDIDDKYRERLESMLAVDEMIASLVQELEAAGKLDDTYIFFTSDNGMSLGEHRRRSGKRLPYEELAHVPLFVRGPGLAAGSKIEKLTLNTDFAPTFADIAGTRFRADGRSLLPLFSNEESPSWRAAVLLEGFPQAEGDEEGDNEGGRGSDRTVLSPAYGAIRTDSYKYVEYDNGEKELYDLEADSYELDNVYEGVDPSLLEDLEAKLGALRGCSDEGCREAEDAS